MPIRYTFENSENYLCVTASGNGNNLKEVESYAKAVIGAVIEYNAKNVLCNELELTHELTGIDTFNLGELVSKFAGEVQRVAIVCSEKDLPKEQFYELVTNNRGLYLRVFSDLEKGREWVMKEIPGK